VKAVWDGLMDLLAARRCAGCDEALDPAEEHFCGLCEPLLEPADRRDAGRAAYVYGGPLADAIRRLKYGRRTDLAWPLGLRLAEAALGAAGEVDAVIPVPLHPRRLRQRGFNQAALLARPVAQVLAVPLVTGALRRRRDTVPQASLEPAARGRNVRGAFVVTEAPPPRVLLLDDVRTTGATLTECAERLRAAGVERVRTLVLARAEP
jgi:ComF family protein